MEENKSTEKKTVLEKFYECKCKYPDAICLFRVGDFYEVYERDAIDSAEILGIAISGRKGEHTSRYCSAGFPVSSLDECLSKLIRAGRRVAIN